MHSDESAKDFLSHVEAGEESALGEVHVRYADQLVAFAGRRINDRLERHYSAEDAAASAIGSFCGRARGGRYRFDHTGALWSLLRTFALNKIRRAAQKHRRELAATVETDDAGPILELFGREPNPGEIAERVEEFEHFLAGFSTRNAEICRLWFEGHASINIAQELDISVSTVNRELRAIRDVIREKLRREMEN